MGGMPGQGCEWWIYTGTTGGYNLFIFVSEVEYRYLYGYCYYIHVVLTARVPLEVSVVGTQECT